VTEGQHYRRYMAQQKRREAAGLRDAGAAPKIPRHGLTITRQGVNAGKGFCFVDHVGDVYPSGFLPRVTTNVRKQPIYDIYRNHYLFKALRDTSNLQGRCGRCEFKEACGGSRARAYAITGNLFAEDPCCAYVPVKAPTHAVS
jgi:radical SAM protein with 4Fe4S-binding SPASM domain